jgi:hypothetical protein
LRKPGACFRSNPRRRGSSKRSFALAPESRRTRGSPGGPCCARCHRRRARNVPRREPQGCDGGILVLSCRARGRRLFALAHRYRQARPRWSGATTSEFRGDRRRPKTPPREIEGHERHIACSRESRRHRAIIEVKRSRNGKRIGSSPSSMRTFLPVSVASLTCLIR